MSKRRQPKSEKEVSVAIIGPGRLGQAMGRLLLEAGIAIDFVAGRRMEQSRRAVRFIGGGKAVSLVAPRLGDARVILITTSDAAVGSVARQVALCRDDWSGRVVLHTCGSLPASALETFKRRGAWTASLHPYQTVPTPRAGVRNLVGSFWALEGDRQAKALAKRWVKALQGTSFEISPKAKSLYHLSAFLVCPTVVTLMDCSQKLLQEAGVPRKIAKPMLERFVGETAKNFAELGTRKALTGPAVRSDWETLERHLDQLRRFAPEVVPAYRELVRLMLKLAGVAPAKSSAFK
ncbi:MAG TPA: Rossmann-like and DUF2520 domain-containing protein [Terriglobia bacterium]|nr:Rossmann-like and DUF2520 domain-containing protein [Terriglobia bacterium]